MVGLLLKFLLIISGAEFARQIADKSVLSLRVKQLLLLNQPYNRKLFAFKDIRTWYKLLKLVLFILFFVLIIPAWILVNLHHFFSEVLDCKYCISVWIGAAINYYVIGMPTLEAILLTPLYIIAIYLIDLIDR